MLEFTDEHDYDNDVVAQSINNTVVVKFSATWCGPCKTVQPTFQKMTKQEETQ